MTEVWKPDYDIVLPDGRTVPVMSWGEAILTEEDFLADQLSEPGDGPRFYSYLTMGGKVAKITPLSGATLRPR